MFICTQTINFITHSFLKILQRNRKWGIQLLRLHLGGGQGASIYNNMQIGKGRGLCQCERSPINYWKAYSDLQKERGIQKWAGIVVKSRKRSGAAQKTIIWIKGRAVKFHKSSITYSLKAVLQPKKQQSAAITQWA